MRITQETIDKMTNGMGPTKKGWVTGLAVLMNALDTEKDLTIKLIEEYKGVEPIYINIQENNKFEVILYEGSDNRCIKKDMNFSDILNLAEKEFGGTISYLYKLF